MKLYEYTCYNRSYNHSESYNPKLTMAILAFNVKTGDKFMDMGIDNEFHMKLDLKKSRFEYTLFMLRPGRSYNFNNSRSYHKYRRGVENVQFIAGDLPKVEFTRVIACPVKYKTYIVKLGSIKANV